MNTNNYLLLVIVICVPILSPALFSCSGTQTLNQTPEQSELATALPPLPGDKEISELSGATIEGSEAFSFSLNAAVVDSDLELQSSANKMSWGIWRLQPGEDELRSVELLLNTNGDDVVYAAVANYSTGQWDFDGPLTVGKELTLDNVANRSPVGNCYVAVITSGGDISTVNRLVMTENRVGWQIVTVDDDFVVGEQSSLVVIDGKPAISYYDDSAADALKFIRSSTNTGADPEDWGEPTTIVTGWIAYSDLVEVEGNPAVCFWYEADGIRYSRSSTVDGADPEDWNIVTVDNIDNAGHYCSMAVVAGNPAISYANNPGFDLMTLRYARSTTPTGDTSGAWTQKVEVDSGGETGTYSSLAVIDGNPAISYLDQTNFLLKFARSTTATGADVADWSQIVVVDSNGGTYTSLAIIDGNPAISYWDERNDDLKYARSLTASGAGATDWLQNAVVHADAQPGVTKIFTSLAVIDGKPAIAYPFGESGFRSADLGFAISSTSTGGDSADWNQKETVDDVGFVGTHCCLAVVGGRPAISYFDEHNNNLKYAILFR